MQAATGQCQVAEGGGSAEAAGGSQAGGTAPHGQSEGVAQALRALGEPPRLRDSLVKGFSLNKRDG